ADLDAIDTAQLLGLVAAREALRDAGYGPESDFDRSRVSVVLGVTGTQEVVIPLGARLGHPRGRKALKESGGDDATAQGGGRRGRLCGVSRTPMSSGRRTRSPAFWATSWPGASPIGWTCRGRTVWSMRPAPVRSAPSTWRGSSCRPGERIWRLPVGWTRSTTF